MAVYRQSIIATETPSTNGVLSRPVSVALSDQTQRIQSNQPIYLFSGDWYFLLPQIQQNKVNICLIRNIDCFTSNLVIKFVSIKL